MNNSTQTRTPINDPNNPDTEAAMQARTAAKNANMTPEEIADGQAREATWSQAVRDVNTQQVINKANSEVGAYMGSVSPGMVNAITSINYGQGKTRLDKIADEVVAAQLTDRVDNNQAAADAAWNKYGQAAADVRDIGVNHGGSLDATTLDVMGDKIASAQAPEKTAAEMRTDLTTKVATGDELSASEQSAAEVLKVDTEVQPENQEGDGDTIKTGDPEFDAQIAKLKGDLKSVESDLGDAEGTLKISNKVLNPTVHKDYLNNLGAAIENFMNKQAELANSNVSSVGLNGEPVLAIKDKEESVANARRAIEEALAAIPPS